MMEQEYILRKEYDEHSKRMEDEHRRMNHRIGEVEKGIEENNKLLLSVEKLAINMEALQKEQKDQGTRLAKVESRDGELWRKAVSHVVTVIIGIVLGYIAQQLGI